MSAGARPLREKPREGGVWSPQSTAAVAAPPSAAEPEAGLIKQLGDLRDRATRDPFTNPIRLLALDLVRQLDGPLAGDALDELIQRLTVNAAAGRASHLRRYLGELDAAANLARIGDAHPLHRAGRAGRHGAVRDLSRSGRARLLRLRHHRASHLLPVAGAAQRADGAGRDARGRPDRAPRRAAGPPRGGAARPRPGHRPRSRASPVARRAAQPADGGEPHLRYRARGGGRALSRGVALALAQAPDDRELGRLRHRRPRRHRLDGHLRQAPEGQAGPARALLRRRCWRSAIVARQRASWARSWSWSRRAWRSPSEPPATRSPSSTSRPAPAPSARRTSPGSRARWWAAAAG